MDRLDYIYAICEYLNDDVDSYDDWSIYDLQEFYVKLFGEDEDE